MFEIVPHPTPLVPFPKSQTQFVPPLVRFSKLTTRGPQPESTSAVKFTTGNGFTTIEIVLMVAHCPAVGVNVYVVVARLFIAGDQVPLIPFVDVVGKAASGSPEQIAATGIKVGVVDEFTFIVSVVVVAHCPAVGVKV